MIRASATRRPAGGERQRRWIGAAVLLGIAACTAIVLIATMPAALDPGDPGVEHEPSELVERLGRFMVVSLEQAVHRSVDASSVDVELAVTAAERYLTALVERSSLTGLEGSETASRVSVAARRVVSAVETGDSHEARRILAEEVVPAVDGLAPSGAVVANTTGGSALGRIGWAAAFLAPMAIVMRRRSRSGETTAGTPVMPSPGAPVDLADVVAGALNGLDLSGIRTVAECAPVLVDTQGNRLARAVRVLVVAAAQRGGEHVGIFSRPLDGRAEVIVAHDGEPGMGIDGRHASIALRRVGAELAALGARIEVETSPHLTVCAISLPTSPMVAAA